MSTESIIKTTEPLTVPEDDTELSEPDEFAHYVKVKALIAGGPQIALCGKKWVPTTIGGAMDLPICPTCKELHAFLGDMYGKDA